VPLSENFTATQALGYPSQIIFTDTSTGSDGAIAARRIEIVDSDGNYIVEEGTTTNYEVWPYADATITLDLLTIDRAVYVTVYWVNSGGATLYDKTELTVFRLYSITYYIYLIKSQSSNTKLKDNANFYQNEIKLLCSLQEAYDAVYYAGDIKSSQAALTRAKTLVDNPANFF
jgi:hypothetical protein